MKNQENQEINNVENKEVKEKKVSITIPKDPLNKNDSFVPVVINGDITQIKRGVKVEVSEEIERILREAGYIA